MWKNQGSWNFFHAKLIPNSSIYGNRKSKAKSVTQYRTARFVFYPYYIAAPIVLGIERSTLCPAYCRRLCNLDDAAFCRPNSQGDRSSITSHDRKYIMLNLKDMIMLRLTQTEDFKTIISSCSTEEQVQKASDNFILKVVALCDTEEDTVSLFRILRYTRCRLQAMQKAYPLNGEGEKCVRTTQCH